MARPLVDEFFAGFFQELQDLAASRGLQVRAREGFRSRAAQAAAIAARGVYGRGGFAAPVGRSYHQYGQAIDVSLQPAGPQAWALFGQLAESLGFRWGGRFQKREPWHIDLGTLLTISEARAMFHRDFLVEVS